MSKKITLTPASRKANRTEFVKANPWTPGKTLGEIKALVDSGAQKLAGPFVFPEATAKAKKTVTRKTDTATTKANKKAKRSKASKESAAKREAFVSWLHETAEERAARKAFNGKAAKWARKNGIVPTGTAWAAIKEGERDVETLKSMNVDDDLRPAKGATKTAPVEKAKKGKKETTVIAAEVEPTAPARPRRVNGTFMNKEEAALFNTLTGNGLDEKIAQQAVSGLVGLL